MQPDLWPDRQDHRLRVAHAALHLRRHAQSRWRAHRHRRDLPQVEQIHEVLEAVAVGQQIDHDERIVLFVRLREGITLDDALRERIRRQIRANTTPRHVPAVIAQVPDIPRTRSGKTSEIAVRDVINGRAVKNTEALASPEALDEYRRLNGLHFRA